MAQFWNDTLSVVPINGNLILQKGELAANKFCGDSEFTTVADNHLLEGVSDTDLILYVSGRPSTRFCGPSTLSVAVACIFYQHDRPTAGAIIFFLDQVQLVNNSEETFND